MRSIRGNVRALVGVSAVLGSSSCSHLPALLPATSIRVSAPEGRSRPRSRRRRRSQGSRSRPTERSSRAATPTPRRGMVALARYEPNGKLDTTFGSGGIVTGPVLGNSKRWRFSRTGRSCSLAIALTRIRDGRSSASSATGQTEVSTPRSARMAWSGGRTAALIRWRSRQTEGSSSPGPSRRNTPSSSCGSTPTGRSTPSFGSNGSVRTLLGYCRLRIRRDRPAGWTDPGRGARCPGILPRHLLRRRHPRHRPHQARHRCPGKWPSSVTTRDGSLDPSFGSSGVVTTRLGPGSQLNPPATFVALQPDGKIVAASGDRRAPRAGSLRP